MVAVARKRQVQVRLRENVVSLGQAVEEFAKAVTGMCDAHVGCATGFRSWLILSHAAAVVLFFAVLAVCCAAALPPPYSPIRAKMKTKGKSQCSLMLDRLPQQVCRI